MRVIDLIMEVPKAKINVDDCMEVKDTEYGQKGVFAKRDFAVGEILGGWCNSADTRNGSWMGIDVLERCAMPASGAEKIFS